jgi:hypothetical protein
MPRCRIEGQEVWRIIPLKALEKLGHEKYARVNITPVNMVLTK